MARRLPVAPRPFRDELLSSWMARVACRYGLTAPELAGQFAHDGRCYPSPLSIDDRTSAQDQTRGWAQACGVDPDRLQRLALSRRYPQRPRSWYSNRGPEWAPSATPGSTPVCVSCFDADHAADRDAWLRAGWKLAERCICPVHDTLLHDRCMWCHRRLSVAFRLREEHARPTCRCCGRLLTGRAGEGAQRRDTALVTAALNTQERITANVNRASPERDQIEKALAMLWAPLDHPDAARPVLALWFNEAGWRCPCDVRHAVGTATPLGQLPVRWRFVTLLALNDVFGVDPLVDGAIPVAAARLVRRAAPRQRRFINQPSRLQIANPAPRRSAADYDRLARQLLANSRWVAAQHLPERQRDRVRARLIDAALSRPSMPTVRPLPGGSVAAGNN